MLILLASLVLLGLLAALLSWLHRRRTGEEEQVVVAAGDCGSCDGNNSKCEQECMLEAATKPVEYFDDEELDQYRGRQSDEYTDDETGQFAEVLETLRPDEVKPWGRSLLLRGINMPNGIKDEFIALTNG